MEHVEAIIIGAGVVGLAVARALAEAGREVMVLEAAGAVGTGVSSRNSEVVHAGIYYPPGSLKARACIKGKALLLDYCAVRGVPHATPGKLIVATSEAQVAELDAIQARAALCGMVDLHRLSGTEAQAMEPQVCALAALHSPGTGIIDSHALMLALQGDIEAMGGQIVLHAPVLGLTARQNGFQVDVGGAEPLALSCDILVNSASLNAVALAAGMVGYDSALSPQAFLAKGHYVALAGTRPPFTHLVYPVPEPGGLGIHATVDLGGQVRFGPDVLWVGAVDYAPGTCDIARFRTSIGAYWPGVANAELIPSYTGIRPKISGPGSPNADFIIQCEKQHGLKGLIHMFGIESPGLTSCLALGQEVLAALQGGSALRVAG